MEFFTHILHKTKAQSFFFLWSKPGVLNLLQAGPPQSWFIAVRKLGIGTRPLILIYALLLLLLLGLIVGIICIFLQKLAGR